MKAKILRKIGTWIIEAWIISVILLLPIHSVHAAEGVLCDLESGTCGVGMAVKGPDQAPVTVIAYADFLSPASNKAMTTLYAIMKSYPDDIRVVLKHYPSLTNDESILAHEAAVAAETQGKFWEMHDQLLAHQGKLTKETLQGFARQIKLDVQKFQKALETHPYKKIILKQAQEAKGFGVTTAPTFFVNGQKLIGARSLENFKQAVDVALGIAPAPSQPVAAPPAPAAIVKIDSKGAASIGPDDAPVVIVEYSDFQCPFCARVVPTLKSIAEKYPKQVRIAFKHFPLDFHPKAKPAHMASMAAEEQGKFWEMHDRIFEHQSEMSPEHLTAHAQEIGLNLDQFKKSLNNTEYQKEMEQNLAEGRQLGVTGTPTFFVNGKRLVGAKPLEAFVELIEEELKK
jgi:protein-disulfide isomerase